MKRFHPSQDDDESDNEGPPPRVVLDWIALFHMESILSVMHPYLSTTDLIRLSRVNKRMNTTWINCERRLAALNMRDRVHKLTGRLYNVRNPILYMKKAITESCRLPKLGARRFRCWECSRSVNVSHLTHDRRWFPCATCQTCARLKMGKAYVWVEFYNVRDYLARQLMGEFLFRQVYDWCAGNKETIEPVMQSDQRVFVTYHGNNVVPFVPKSVLLPLVEKARQEIRVTKKH